ncbi:MAG: DUF1566 domain-containing protein [Myxococcaceae bacterium]|nr:DUF1566 domain-containing protein [Myxococcaceae bacterium]
MTPAHALVVTPAQVLQAASSVTPIHAPGVARTQAMRVDPLRRADAGYRGPRYAQDVPALEWDRKSPEAMTFEEAKAYAASRSSEGWRLPTIWELEALYQQRGVLGEEDEDWYWSGTPVDGEYDLAWLVHFYYGLVNYYGLSYTFYVRCAR